MGWTQGIYLIYILKFQELVRAKSTVQELKVQLAVILRIIKSVIQTYTCTINST